MPTVTVRYFAVLREQRGRDEERVVLEPADTPATLYRRLFPPGPRGALTVAFARNLEYVSGDVELADGDEVAFLPPLGGG